MIGYSQTFFPIALVVSVELDFEQVQPLKAKAYIVDLIGLVDPRWIIRITSQFKLIYGVQNYEFFYQSLNIFLSEFSEGSHASVYPRQIQPD